MAHVMILAMVSRKKKKIALQAHPPRDATLVIALARAMIGGGLTGTEEAWVRLWMCEKNSHYFGVSRFFGVVLQGNLAQNLDAEPLHSTC